MGFDVVSIFTIALLTELVVVAGLALLLRSTRRAQDLSLKRFTK